MNRTRGFLLPFVALLLAVAALLVGDTLRGAAVDQALATSALERQRAFEAAEWGLAQAEVSIRERRPVAEELVTVDARSQARVTTRVVVIDSLPFGFSAGRVRALRLLATSDGRAPRGTHVTVAAGLTQLEPAP